MFEGMTWTCGPIPGSPLYGKTPAEVAEILSAVAVRWGWPADYFTRPFDGAAITFRTDPDDVPPPHVVTKGA